MVDKKDKAASKTGHFSPAQEQKGLDSSEEELGICGMHLA
jgi:hypothetical protein